MKQISLDNLNVHLFETIEMLKSNNDPEASPNEKIDVETAKTIADIGKVVVDGYKVKLQALNIISKADNPNAVSNTLKDSGIVNNEQLKLDK